MSDKKSLQQQADEILKNAEERGLQSNFFFRTTFKRYQVQMATLVELEKAIKDHGPTFEKEYVKGRQNICINPAITAYNKPATAANNTVSTLIKIVDSFKGEEAPTSLADVMAQLMSDE